MFKNKYPKPQLQLLLTLKKSTTGSKNQMISNLQKNLISKQGHLGKKREKMEMWRSNKNNSQVLNIMNGMMKWLTMRKKLWRKMGKFWMMKKFWNWKIVSESDPAAQYQPTRYSVHFQASLCPPAAVGQLIAAARSIDRGATAQQVSGSGYDTY